MFENHSFDEMLGTLRQVYPQLEGVDSANPASNRDTEGQVFSQQPTNETSISPDPPHELNNVLFQIRDNNANFVFEYSREHPETTPRQRQRIMGYSPLDSLPALHVLARQFTV